MNWKAKISLIMIFTMVFSIFMYQGWFMPKQSDAYAITSAATGNWNAPATWANTVRTGTITTSNVSAAVTGVGTSFTTEIRVGDIITTTGGVTIGTVLSITNNTSLTFTGNAASTNTGIAYHARTVPIAGDTVTIGATHTVTVTAPAACTSIAFTAPNTATPNGITINGTNTLTVSGAITMTIPTTVVTTSTIAVGTGTLSAGSITIPGSGTAGRFCTVSVSTGTINCTGNISFSGTAAQARLTFTGAGVLNIGGNLATGGTFAASTGTVNFNGSGAQTAAGYTYNILKVNNTAGLTMLAASTIPTLTIGDVTANSLFDDGNFQVTSTGTLNLTSGTMRLGSAATPAFATRNIAAGTTVEYDLAGAQAVGAFAFRNLTFTGSGAKTMPAGTSVTGTLSIAPTGTATASVTAGQNLSVANLTIANLGRINGTWGGTTSSATNINPTYFAATTGYLTVTNDTRANSSVTTWPTAGSITYGQTLASSTLSGGSATPAGSFAFTTPSTAPNAGTASQSVTYTPTDLTSYKTSTGTASVTVDKANSNVTTWPTATAITHGQTLASSTLSGGSATPAGNFAFTSPSTVPNIGTALQSVTYTPADINNYNTATGSVSVTVNADCTAAAPSVTFLETTKNIITDNGNVTYSVRIKNNDAGSECSNPLTIGLASADSNTPKFSSSIPASVSLAPGANQTVTLTVTEATAADGENTTTTVTASAGGHSNGNGNIVTTYIKNNPLIHNSITVNSGRWATVGGWGILGGKYGEFVCETCHARTTGNIKRIKETITAPNGSFPGGWVSFQSAKGGSSDFGDDSNTHATSTKVCEVCHTYDATQLNGVKFHAYDMSAGGADKTHNNKTDCMACHAHKSGFKGSACNSCHGNPPTANSAGGPDGLANTPYATGSITAGAHDKHVNGMGFSNCLICHNGYSMPTDVASYTVDVSFNFIGSTTGAYDGWTSVRYSAGNTNSGTLTCSTVYCHSAGQGSTGGSLAGGDYASPAWGTTAQNCGSCHKNMKTDPAATGKHLKHAQTIGIACATCHSGYTESTVNNGTHVNRAINLGFSGQGTGTTYSEGNSHPTASGYGTCSTSACHSSGQGPDGTSTGITYDTPAWNGGALNCGSCHKNMDTDNTAPGSHVMHAQTENISCATCHNGYTEATVIAGTHNNASINLSFSGRATGAGYTQGLTHPVNNGYGNCSTTYCHSTGLATPTYIATPAWGSSATGACGTCHGAEAATPPASAAHAKHVGSSSVYKFSCKKCHNATVDATAADSTTKPGIANRAIHADTTRDVDLNTGDSLVGSGATDNGSGTCSNVYCHSTGKNGIVPTAQLPAAYGSSHFSSVSWGTTLNCAGCHGKSQAGYPDYTMADQNLDKGTARANSHQSGTHRLTLCNACHVNTTADGSTIASSTHVNAAINVNIDPGFATGSATYNGDRTCSNVACHGTSSPAWGAAGDCTSCHEAGLNNISGFHSRHWEIAAGNATTRTTGNASTATYYQFQCNTCHTGGTHPTGNSGSNFADVGFNISWVTTAYQANGTYTVNSNGNDTTDSRGQKISTDGSCSSVYCHSSGIAPGGSLTYANISWNATAQSPDCGVCHAATPTTNRHTIHASTYSYGCTECHQATVSDSSTISDKTKHVNAINDVSWKTTGGLNAGSDAYETAGADTCSNLYCHSQGTSNVSPYPAPNTAAVWTNPTTATCIGCHSGDASSGNSMSSNKHGAHVNNSAVNGVNYSCDICHSATASGNRTIGTPSNHVNKQVNVAFTALNSGSTYTGTNTPGDAVGSCNNLYCHSNGKTGTGVLAYTNPGWGNAAPSIGCNGCHGTGTASGYPDYASGAAGSATANSHAKHAGSSAGQANINCSACHYAVTTNGTAINGASPALHINANLQNVDFAAAYGGSYTGVTRTCGTTYCHSNAQGANGSGVPSSYASPQWGSVTLNCGSCHNDMSTAGGTGSHTLHATATGTVYDCSVCHGAGYSATTVTYPSHVNKTINISFTGTGTGTSYTQAAGTLEDGYGNCSTSNCHGSGTMTWGNNTAATRCEKCHGSAATAAGGSFKDTAGATTGSRAGAHKSHLASSHNFTNDIACTECHKVPTGVNDTDHMDSAGPAELTWGALATKGGAVTPGYTGGVCSTTYCHGTGIGKGFSGGSDKNPSWSTTTYFTGVAASDCGKCHGYPPGDTHPSSTNCSQCHTHVNVTNDGFTNASLHVNMTVEYVDNCGTCHTNANLSATHAKHVDADTILAGKSLSAGNYGQAAWFYNVTYVNGVPKYACGYCHPSNQATHANNTKNLDFNPADPNAAGTVKSKNKDNTSFTQTQGSSVICSNVYCHSNGYDGGSGYAYQTTPNWYGGLFAGDKCAACHGNSPNSTVAGSPAHYSTYTRSDGASKVKGHFVGIHFDNIYNGTSGLASAGNTGTGSHGSSATSSTINCQTCHNETVASSANDNNTVCVTCHSGGTAKGSAAIWTSTSKHINGVADVAFDPITVKSKAQLRDASQSVISGIWDRTASGVAYKNTGAYDQAVGALNTGAQYVGGTKTCTVSCHNSSSVTWGATSVSCSSCHTGL